MTEWQTWIDTVRAPLPDSAPAPMPQTARGWRQLLALAAVCGIAALVSVLLSRQPGSVAGVWLANAPATAWLMFSAPRRWPALLAAAGAGILAANLVVGDPLLRALAFLPGNLVEIALAATLLRRAGLHEATMRRPVDLLRLLALGGVLPQMVGALLAMLALASQAMVPQLHIALTWLQGSVIGALAALPLSVALLRQPWAEVRAEWTSSHMAWLIPLAVGTTLLCLAQVPFPFIYLSLPLLASAMLVGFAAVSLLTLLVALTVALALATGVFVPPPVTAEWQNVFVYLPYAAALVPAQLLAATMAQMRDTQARLAARSEQLRRANEGLEQFVRIASHDLREPLNTVVQFTGLLEADLGAALPPDARHYLSLVNGAAGRMRGLLDDVLQYTRVQRADWPPPEPVALDAVLDEVRQALAGRLRETGALLHVGELPPVRGHAPLLGLLFQNLVGNAIKFVPPGRVPQVSVTARAAGDQVIVSVSDNGIGIAEADRAKLFKPFVRLQLRRHYEGTGLGLALSRQIVQAHGGTIEVVPQAGEGTCFELRLPRA